MRSISIILFARLYLFYFLLGPIVPVLYWTISKDAAVLPKFIYYPAILVAFTILIKSRKIQFRKDWFVQYLLLYSTFLICYGFIDNPINRATFAHIQTLLLPILGFSVGYVLVAKRPDFFLYLESKIIFYGLLLSLLIIIYYFCYKSGLIPYFGASTLISIPILFAYHKRKYLLFTFFLSVSILTGKRTVIIGVLLVILITTLWEKRKTPSLYLAFIPVVFVMMSLFYNYMNDFEILRRIAILFDSDTDFNTATSGRLNDVVGAFEAINESPWHWVFGLGNGAQFAVLNQWNGDIAHTHYTHITPLSYVFLGGGLLAVPIYVRLLAVFSYAINNMHNFYSYVYIYYFSISMSGAILLSDPFVWVFAGVLFSESKVRLRGSLARRF